MGTLRTNTPHYRTQTTHMGTTDMRTCIMLIAGPFEKDYIEEWAEWHHDICGFKEVFVIANNWDYAPKKDYVKTWRLDGQKMQLDAYNWFAHSHMLDYDWVMVMDGDEFLYLPDGRTIEDYFKEADERGVPQVSFQWMMFGSGGEGVPTKGSVVKRFTRASGVWKMEVKSALNFAWCRGHHIVPIWLNPHFARATDGRRLGWLSSIHYPTKEVMKGPTRKDLEGQPVKNTDPFIAHYFTKTKEEWAERRSLPRPDNNQLRDPTEFDNEDHNEVECAWLARRLDTYGN